MPWLNFFQDFPPLFRDDGTPPGLREKWQALKEVFPEQLSLTEIPAACQLGRQVLRQLRDSLKAQSDADWEDARHWVQSLDDTLESAEVKAVVLVNSYKDLARRCDALFQAMDFSLSTDH